MKLKKHNRYAYSPITERQDFSWPDGKRIAFYCALNVEHFSFGEGLGHTPTALGPQPDVRNFGWRDYGLRVGIWRIFDMMDDLKLPMCHLLNASVCEEMPQIAARIRQRGDEVIGHGYTNSERQSDMDEATEAATLGHGLGRVRDHCGLGRFIHVGLALGVGVAVADDFVAALANARCNLRHLFTDRRVEQMAHRQLQFVHHIEDAPDTDAQTVVAPAKVANIGLRAKRRRCMAEA